MKVFTLYDSAAEAYDPPHFIRSTGEAVRLFSNAVKDPQTKVAKHPDDYTLFEIGEFDELTGQISMYNAHKSLGVATEYIAKQ